MLQHLGEEAVDSSRGARSGGEEEEQARLRRVPGSGGSPTDDGRRFVVHVVCARAGGLRGSWRIAAAAPGPTFSTTRYSDVSWTIRSSRAAWFGLTRKRVGNRRAASYSSS